MALDLNGGHFGLPHTVIRIRAGDRANQTAVHSGTGFFYGFSDGDGTIGLIVSNKHVLCGKTWIEFDFAERDDLGGRILGPSIKYRIDSSHIVIFEHPDPLVDLAAVPLLPIIKTLEQAGKKPYAPLLSRHMFPSAGRIQPLLYASTSVLMVGFPNGIMDEMNNLPVVRRGILATNYDANYMGRTDFVVDIAAFGGSSGSPVFAFFDGMMQDTQGNMNMFNLPQVYLLGVLHSGPVMTANGSVISAPVPTSSMVAQVNMMIHIGYCVKAFRIEDLLPGIQKFVASMQP